MKKWLAFGLIAVLLLAVFGAVLIGRNLDSYLNENKELLTEEIQATIGREVAFERIGVTFRNGLGVKLDDVRIGEDARFGSEDFVRAASVEVRIRLIPALLGRYEVARIELVAPRINLIQTADGLNASTMGGGATESESAAPAAGAPVALAIALFDVSDGSVRYVDRTVKPARETVVERFRFSASDISPTAPLSFVASAAIGGGDSTNLHASGSVGPLDPDTASDAPLDLTVSVDALTGAQIGALSLLAQALPETLEIDGPIELEASLAGKLSDMTISAAGRASEATLRFGDGFTKPRGTELSFSLGARRTLDTVSIERAQMTLGPARATASGTVRVAENLLYEIKAVTEPFPLDGWRAMLPALEGTRLTGSARADLTVSTPSADASGPMLDGRLTLTDAGLEQEGMPPVAGVSTVVRFGADRIDLPHTDLTVGGMPATLEASLRNFAAPAGTVVLHAARLTPEAIGAAAMAEAGDMIENLALEARFAAGSDITGTLTSSQGKLSGAPYRNLAAKFAYRDGSARLNPLTMQALGGQVRATGNIELSTDENAEFALKLDAQRIALAETAAWLAPAAQRLVSGTMDLNMSFDGSGNHWERIRTTLDGDGSFELRNGQLENVNLADEVLGSLTGVPGLSTLLSPGLRKRYPALFATGSTQFEDLTSAISITDGRMRTDNLLLRASDYSIAASGTVGLDRTADLRGRFLASPRLTRDLIGEVSAMRYLSEGGRGVTIPFRLSGDLTSARPQLDRQFIVQALQKALIGNLTDQLFGPRDGTGPRPQ